MKISNVKVQTFRQPVPEMGKVHFGPTVDISLVTLATDPGIEGYSMGRAVGGAWGIDAEGLVSLPQKTGLGLELDWDFVNAQTIFRS